MAERMAEQKWLYKCFGLILGVFPSDLVCDLSLFWEMLFCWFLIPLVGMAEWQKEWQNGRMAEMDTYVLFMVHADTDTDTDTDDT